MAPLASEFISFLVSLNARPDVWASTVDGASEQLQSVSETVDTSAVWAWFAALFASVVSFCAPILPSSFAEGTENVGEWITRNWAEFSQFLLQDHVRKLLLVWFIVFWVVLFIPLILGFGPKGVLAGSAAAWFQSVVYGAFTPAGGVFAVLTLVGMMGVAYPPAVLLAVTIASAVTAIVSPFLG